MFLYADYNNLENSALFFEKRKKSPLYSGQQKHTHPATQNWTKSLQTHQDQKPLAHQVNLSSKPHKQLDSQKIWNVEELETLPAGTKPRTSHHQSPRAERHRKRKHETIFFERTREGHCQSDEHWNHFKVNAGKTSERQGGVHVGFSKPKCTDTILIWTIFSEPI